MPGGLFVVLFSNLVLVLALRRNLAVERFILLRADGLVRQVDAHYTRVAWDDVEPAADARCLQAGTCPPAPDEAAREAGLAASPAVARTAAVAKSAICFSMLEKSAALLSPPAPSVLVASSPQATTAKSPVATKPLMSKLRENRFMVMSSLSSKMMKF